MMTITNDRLTVERHTRRVVIQRVTKLDQFTALRALGYSEALAAALVSGLVSIQKKGEMKWQHQHLHG